MRYSYEIKRVSCSEYYTAPNGDHVSITVIPDDTATLIICAPVNNKMIFHQQYKSRRSAFLAMQKRCGKCEFQSMTQTYRKGDSTNGNARQSDVAATG